MNDAAPNGQPSSLAPHPTLSQYYGEDANRPKFIQGLFDHTARSYDRLERMVGLGTGPWYRRDALARAGLTTGMRVLDVAIGTGLVAREAAALVGDPRLVTGLDPSTGMLLQARDNLRIAGVRAFGERLPLRDGSFDFLSMGYALRHLEDLAITFKEFLRVLAPGGKVCVLELTPPSSRLGRALLRAYLKGVVPLMARIAAGGREGQVLMAYFWDTVQSCVPPPRILAALHAAGFVRVRRTLAIGIFSEYTATRPGPGVIETVSGEDLMTTGSFAIRVLPVYQPPRGES